MSLRYCVLHCIVCALITLEMLISMHVTRTLHWSIKAIASEVFMSLNNRNPNFMNKMFQVKDITYDLRDSNI